MKTILIYLASISSPDLPDKALKAARKAGLDMHMKSIAADEALKTKKAEDLPSIEIDDEVIIAGHEPELNEMFEAFKRYADQVKAAEQGETTCMCVGDTSDDDECVCVGDGPCECEVDELCVCEPVCECTDGKPAGACADKGTKPAADCKGKKADAPAPDKDAAPTDAPAAGTPAPTEKA